jgi:hypothetical protein
MANIAVAFQQIVIAGIAPAYTGSLSASNQYQVPNDGRVFLHFKKTGAGACTVTIVTQKVYKGLQLPNRTFVVPATTGDVMAGPWEPDLVNDANQLLNFTLSEITGLSVAALYL